MAERVTVIPLRHARARAAAAASSSRQQALHPLPWVLVSGLYVIAATIVAGWLALAVVHRSDGYRVAHTQGVWIAAAESARAGQLYPPLFDGQHYAGTRYMPLAILLNGGAAAAAGAPLAGGKAVAAVLMIVLLALMVLVLRRMACPSPLTAALSATVLASETGLQAGTTIGGDLLPAVLQLGALTAVLHGTRARAIALAGVLAGLAIASKLTGLWAALAIVTWLAARRQWRTAGAFSGTCLVTTTAVLGVVQALTRGGLSEHLLTFAAAGVGGPIALLRAPNQLLYELTTHASGAVVLLPVAAVGVLVTGGWRRQPAVHLALGYALLLLLAVYADVGTGFNQLLDLVILTALAVGQLAGRAAGQEDSLAAPLVLLFVAVTVAWAAGIDLVRTVARDVRLTAATAGQTAAMPDAELVARHLEPDQSVLSEDPAIDVARGRQPIVMDPFMLVRLERTHPEWVDPLVERIARREFDVVALVVRLENRDADFWWAEYSMGPRVADALRAAYRPDGRIGRYHIYRPAR